MLQDHIDEAMNKTDHPDFQRYTDPQFVPNIVLDPVDMDVDLFAKVVESNIQSWHNKVRTMQRLQADDKPFAIASYEQFLEDSDYLLRHILKAANISIRCTDAQVQHNVHRVHSDRVRDSVTNYNTIFSSFTYARYPSWGDLAANFSQKQIV